MIAVAEAIVSPIMSVLGAGVRDAWNDPSNLAYLLLQSCKIGRISQDDEEIYVERQGLEQRIADHVRRTTPRKYLVVVGPRGGGKTTAVKKMLMGRGKVVYVTLESEVETIQANLRSNLGIPSDKVFKVKDAFKAFEGLHGVDKPVLVVEIDSNVSSKTVKEQSQELKILCTDAKLAHGILILSDANATFKLNTDEDRQEILWITDLDENEMNALLDKFGILPKDDPDSAALRRRLWNEVGANAQDLVKMAKKARKAAGEAGARAAAGSAAERGVVERYIEEKQQDAFYGVHNLLTTIPIDKDTRLRLPNERWNLLSLTASLDRSPGGVAPDDSGVSPVNLSIAVKPTGCGALTYNGEGKRFQFYSKAHQHAARRWLKRRRIRHVSFLILLLVLCLVLRLAGFLEAIVPCAVPW